MTGFKSCLASRRQRVISGLLAAVLGLLVGTSVATAHTAITYSSAGTVGYYVSHSWSNQWPYGPPAYGYDKNTSLWANASYPNTTSMSTSGSTYIANGWSGQSDNPWIGPFWIYDEYGNNSKISYAFTCVPIAQANYISTSSIGWSYGSFNSTNNAAIDEQHIWSKSFFQGQSCWWPILTDKDFLLLYNH